MQAKQENAVLATVQNNNWLNNRQICLDTVYSIFPVDFCKLVVDCYLYFIDKSVLVICKI